jgi:hypothetical protein
MFENLLSPEVQQFIYDHHEDDVNELLLKGKSISGVTASIIVDQIKGREKSRTKLPTYFIAKKIVFPPSINLEQCSSERTAMYKVEFLKSLMGENSFNICADLTGGF